MPKPGAPRYLVTILEYDEAEPIERTCTSKKDALALARQHTQFGDSVMVEKLTPHGEVDEEAEPIFMSEFGGCDRVPHSEAS